MMLPRVLYVLPRVLCALLCVLQLVCLSTACAAAKGADGPIAIQNWTIRWDRFAKKVFVEAVLKNTSGERLSDVKSSFEFLSHSGTVVKTATPWSISAISGRAETRMKFTSQCPLFNRYQMNLTGRKGSEPFKQLFEGKYWPDRLGDIPSPPEPIIFSEGSAHVRIIGSQEELLRESEKEGEYLGWLRKREIEVLVISGMVQNMSDCPAENVVVKIQLLDGEKTVATKECKVGTQLQGKGTAPFKVVLRPAPHYTKVKYRVDFQSIVKEETPEKNEKKKFDVEGRPLLIKDCSIDPKTGLFRGTLINQSEKTIYEVIVTVNLKKGDRIVSYKIELSGDILPRSKVPISKTTAVGFDEGLSVEVHFKQR